MATFNELYNDVFDRNNTKSKQEKISQYLFYQDFETELFFQNDPIIKELDAKLRDIVDEMKALEQRSSEEPRSSELNRILDRKVVDIFTKRAERLGL